ncbi:MAG: tetratricopeptide repeat protein, partial [Acidobacteriota bacterium]|nr:tetratricopeptide repeat protein [Acidobacteriota bacterium]
NEDAQGLTILAGIYQEIHETENVPEYFQKSKDVLEKAVKLDPNDAVAHSMLADVLSQIGDKQGAIREQKEAVRLNPKNLNSLTTLGVWQHNANDVSAARKTYEEVLKINPNYIYALLRYGLLENEAGNVDNAKRLFIRATDAPRTEQLDESFAKRAKAELQKMDGEIK